MNKHARGFSLIEIMIAVALFAALSIGLYQVISNYLNTVKTYSERDRVKRMSDALNVDLLNGIMPNQSNLSSLLQQGVGENIVANNFSQRYYLLMTSPFSSIQTSDLCYNINFLPSGSTFSVQLLNGDVINNVIYLLISPTGKGENTLQLNNLPSTANNVGNLITVQPGSTITLSPFDIVKYETVDNYGTLCSSLSQYPNANTSECNYIIDDDSSMSAVANMTIPSGSIVCITPGNYHTNLIINGNNIILNQIYQGEVIVPQVGFYGNGEVDNLQLQANSSAGSWNVYTFNKSNIIIQSGGLSYYSPVASGLTFLDSSVMINGNVTSGPAMDIHMYNSSMIVHGSVVISGLHMNESVISACGSVGTNNNYGGSAMFLTNSTILASSGLNVPTYGQPYVYAMSSNIEAPVMYGANYGYIYPYYNLGNNSWLEYLTSNGC